jgi:hypothetical protein
MILYLISDILSLKKILMITIVCYLLLVLMVSSFWIIFIIVLLDMIFLMRKKMNTMKIDVINNIYTEIHSKTSDLPISVYTTEELNLWINYRIVHNE